MRVTSTKVMRARTLSVSILLSLILVVSALSPLSAWATGGQADNAQPMQSIAGGSSSPQTDEEIDNLLSAGEYEEGAAIAVIWGTPPAASKSSNLRLFSSQSASLLDSAEQLMGVSTSTYEAAENATVEGAAPKNAGEPATPRSEEGPAAQNISPLSVFNLMQDSTTPQGRDLKSEDSEAKDKDESEISIVFVRKKGMSTREIMLELRKDPRVLSVEPNFRYHLDEPKKAGVSAADNPATDVVSPSIRSKITGNPTKPNQMLASSETEDLTSYQWGCESIADTLMVKDKQVGADINPPKWDAYRSSVGETNTSPGSVAIIDTGVDYTHPDLKDIVLDDLDTITGMGGPHGYNATSDTNPDDPMDAHGHGTHCAGIVAAEWNGYGTSGVASGVKLVPVKAGSVAYISNEAVIKGYEYLAKGVDNGLDLKAINNSWGGPTFFQSLSLAITKLGERGVVSLFASGNETINVDTNASVSSTVSANPYVVIVNAGMCCEAIASFSNWGAATTSVAAPGVGILSTHPTTFANYYPEAISDEASKNIVYESFDSSTPSVEFFFDQTTTTKLGTQTSSYYLDPDGGGRAWTIPMDELQDTSRGDEVSRRSVIMKVDFDAAQVDEMQYFGFSAYTDGEEYSTWAFPYILIKDGDGVERFVRTEDYAFWSASSWGRASLDIGSLFEENGYTPVLDERNRLTVRLEIGRFGEYGPDETFNVDLVGVAKEGSLVPYQYMDGTSMASPMATGAAMVLAQLDDASATPAAQAALRAARLKGSVREAPAYRGKCTSNGTVDLSYAFSDRYTPVPQNASVVQQGGKNIITINGHFFGTVEGAVSVDGISATVVDWGDEVIEVECPDSLSTGVHRIAVRNSDDREGAKSLLLELPSPPSAPSTPLFEKEFSLPKGLTSLDPNQNIAKGSLVGFGGYLYLAASNSYTDYDDVTALWRLDITTGRWTKSKDLPIPLIDVTLATYDKKLFITGCAGESIDKFEQRLFSYDPANDSWTEYDSTNVPLYSTIANFNGKLLFIGESRYDPEADTLEESNVIYSYDLAEGTKKKVGHLSANAWAPLSVACSGDDLYVASDNASEDSITLDRVSWSGSELVGEDVSSLMPSFNTDIENSFRIAAVKKGVALCGAAGADGDGQSEDQDTYVSAFATEGRGATFKPLNKRASHSQLFYVSTTAYQNLLFTFGASYYEPDIFVLRATAVETADQPGDIIPPEPPVNPPKPPKPDKPTKPVKPNSGGASDSARSDSVSTGDTFPTTMMFAVCSSAFVVIVVLGRSRARRRTGSTR